MKLKDQILSLLAAEKGSFVSGEELAARLYVTRAAVWKSIKSLKAEGYAITAVTNKGYALAADTDLFTAAAVAENLTGAAKSLRFMKYRLVASTNAMIRELADHGEAEGVVVLADEQSAGKGRKSRGFFSPANSGLYMSILLRPKYSVTDSLLLTTAAATAVALAIETVTGKNAQIKWVNDVYLDGRKVCGILTEAALAMENGGLDYAVVGIGINVYPPPGGFPPELETVATSLFTDEKTKNGVKSRLAAEILNHFISYYEKLTEKAFLPEYRKRSFLLGQKITVLHHNGEDAATAIAIDDNFRLIVRDGNGEEKALDSGEVSIRLGDSH